MVIKLNDKADLQKVANNLKQLKEVLAVEWLYKKKLYGDRASIDEMSSFKSKQKKQAVVYDPEKERENEEKRKREEAKEDAKRME